MKIRLLLLGSWLTVAPALALAGVTPASSRLFSKVWLDGICSRWHPSIREWDGEWGARLTAVGDARAHYHRVVREVAERLPVTDETSQAGALDRAKGLVRMSVIPGAGHAGLYTRTHRDRYLDEIVSTCGPLERCPPRRAARRRHAASSTAGP